MTDLGDADPVWGDGTREYDTPSVTDRRSLLELLMMERGTLAELSEAHGEDVLPYVLQGIAAELMATSMELYEARETIEQQKAALEGLGAMLMGLSCGPGDEPDPDPECKSTDDEVQYQRLRWSFRRDGGLIRRAAGLADISGAALAGEVPSDDRGPRS